MIRKSRRDEDELDPRRPEWPATRRKVEDYSPDPADWMAPHHMSATETSLRLARWLLAEKLVVSDIDVALTGHELTRRDIPRFPVERFLAERSVTRLDGGSGEGWRGRYLLHGAAHALRLHSDRDEGDVVATLGNGRRLVAQVSRGVVGETRSSAEHKMLRGVIGRAVTFEHYEPSDWGGGGGATERAVPAARDSLAANGSDGTVGIAHPHRGPRRHGGRLSGGADSAAVHSPSAADPGRRGQLEAVLTRSTRAGDGKTALLRVEKPHFYRESRLGNCRCSGEIFPAIDESGGVA